MLLSVFFLKEKQRKFEELKAEIETLKTQINN